MKTFLLTACVLASTSLAETLELPRLVKGASSNQLFSAELKPPVFTNQSSYWLFQEERFLELSASETPSCTATAITTLTLYRHFESGNPSTMWSRALPSTKVFRKLAVFDVDNMPVTVAHREYGESEDSTTFMVFDGFGHMLTNSTIRQQSISSFAWGMTNKELILTNKSNHVAFRFKIPKLL